MSSPGALWQAAQEHVRARRLAAARENLEQLLRLQPVHVPARLLLASVHLADGSLPAALAETLAAARTLPDDAAVIARVAQALHALGETNAARAALAHPAIAASRDAPALLALAQVQQALGQHAQALALIERALALGFDSAELRYFRALQLQFHGRLAEAGSEFAHCLQLRPGHGRAALALARLRVATLERPSPDVLAQQQDVLAQQQAAAAAGSEDEAAFEFARYTGFEALGRDEEAWAALARGNALMHARLPQRPAIAPSALVDAIIARATPEFLADAARAPVRESGATPIFIVGMPRSGTTLLESLLARHPRIAAAGELGDFSKQWRQLAGVHGHAILDPAMLAAEIDFGALGQRYLAQTQWRAAERGFYIDKLPANFWLAGFIRKALPQARILHLVREPMELCFSNWRALFGDSHGWSYDMAALAEQHAQYRRLMRHWHDLLPGAIHDVDYAALVAAPEATLRAALGQLGVDFDPACLHEGAPTDAIATLSSAQVRAPPSDRARRDWQRYAARLEPLRKMLGEY